MVGVLSPKLSIWLNSLKSSGISFNTLFNTVQHIPWYFVNNEELVEELEHFPLVDTRFPNLPVKLFYRLSMSLSPSLSLPFSPRRRLKNRFRRPGRGIFCCRVSQYLPPWVEDAPLALINLATLVGQVSKVIPGRKTPIGGSL